MSTSPITPEKLSSSVIAVPPLARNADLTLNRVENEKLIRHLESGGVTTLLYGGNAVLYHVALNEYSELLTLLTETAGDRTLMIPSVGPAYGTMMDQAAILRDYDFPTAMILPQRDQCTSSGIATGVRRFVESFGRPAVLYIKHDGFLDVSNVRSLMQDGLISWVKYAIVREETADDRYLRELVDTVGPETIVSGIGEQPARTHMQEFGLAGFTSGCVCVAPKLSMDMLNLVKAGDDDRAEQIRRTFEPLEDLRNSINPVRVLHSAVALAGIANTGPILPLLSDLDASDQQRVKQAANELLSENVNR